MKTLNQILREHPEWGDLPVALMRGDGTYEFVDESAMVYKAHTCDDPEADLPDGAPGTYPIVVFTGN